MWFIRKKSKAFSAIGETGTACFADYQSRASLRTEKKYTWQRHKLIQNALNILLRYSQNNFKILQVSCSFKLNFSSSYISDLGTAVAQWLMCCATNRKVTGSITVGVIGIFRWHKILPIALWPWGRLSLWQKWVPGAFPGGKGGRCVRLTTLPQSCAVVMKSGNLKLLEPSGPL